MNAAAVSELVELETAARPCAAVIVKGRPPSDGTAEQFDAFERCYRPSFRERLHVVRAKSRGLYADFGLDYTSYGLGRLADR